MLTLNVGKYVAEQSPMAVQSLPGTADIKRGIGSLAVAVDTDEIGASVTVKLGMATTPVHAVAGTVSHTGI